MRFVVYAAGAVGGVIGGHLALKKHDVLLVCRKEHAEAIHEAQGLRMKSATGDYVVPLRATPLLAAEDLEETAAVLFTPKSSNTERCVEALSKVAPRDVPVVSLQNGVSNEETIARHFDNVLGGVCRMTCSCLQPGQVSFRKTGRLIVGKYPKGKDPFSKKLAGVMEEAGFDVSVSNSIMCDKWLKLVVNLQSAFNAVIDPRDHDSIEFIDLKVGVLEEGRRVLRADKMRFKSCDDRDLSVDDVIAELRKPKAPRSPSAVRVNNSTWQNLYLGRKEMENGFFHGPIIETARKHGIPVPFNEVALEIVLESAKDNLGPGAFRAGEVLEKIRNRGADR
jgi:2-dehydropantoate 2-reductase